MILVTKQSNKLMWQSYKNPKLQTEIQTQNSVYKKLGLADTMILIKTIDDYVKRLWKGSKSLDSLLFPLKLRLVISHQFDGFSIQSNSSTSCFTN